MVASQTIEERMLSTLNFKSSLFEGILDNGSDSVFLEDNKLDKIMESLQAVVEQVEESKENTDSTILSEDLEEVITSTSSDGAHESVSQDPELPFEDEKERSEKQSEDTVSKESNPEQLLQQGISFFSGLAKTLQSPEATKQLVDSIVKVDDKTGETSLHIPVPDKESVANVLTMFGKLFGGN